jgi:hypothetical protein
MFARISVAALIVLIAGSLAAADAQSREPAGSSSQTAPTVAVVTSQDLPAQPADRRLRARVEERYRVVQTRDGFVFVPRRAHAEVRGIELTGDQLLLDGRPVSGAELRTRLGADADVLLTLSYLDVRDRQALFGEEQAAAAASEPQDASPGVSRGRRQGARIRIGSDLYVAENERISDEAVAVFGSIAIDGEVSGDVTAVGGSVRLGPKAVVRGSVTAVGGRIDASPTARVLGETNEVALAWPRDWPMVQVGPNARVRVLPDAAWWSGMAFTLTSARLVIFGLLGLVAVMLAGPLQRRVADEISASPWQAAFVGVAGQLLLVPAILVVCGALLISVIGIPVLALVPVALLVFGALWFVGFAAVADRVGRRLLRLGPDDGRALPAYLAGFVTIVGVLWLARMAWWGGALGTGWAMAIGLVGMAIEAVAWAAGLGGLVLSWLRRARVAQVPAAPAVPAIPVVTSGS